MSGALSLRNRQHTRAVNLRLLRQLIQALLTDLLRADEFDLTIHLVNAREMTRWNESALNHAGSTDVITFDYSGIADGPLIGELLVCVDEAVIQAARYRATWQAELVRYIIHGCLHLRGYDDATAAARRKMKHQEGRLLREMSRRFGLSKLARKPKLTP